MMRQRRRRRKQQQEQQQQQNKQWNLSSLSDQKLMIQRGNCCLHATSDDDNNSNNIDFDSLMDMDVVLFTRNSNIDTSNKIEIGSIQEDGTLTPLSAWTLESAFASPTSTSTKSDDDDDDETNQQIGDYVEFLVFDQDWFPTLTSNDVTIQKVLEERYIAYGSRQVDGGKGPTNPHGEKSELLYYVHRYILDQYKVNVVLRPELEILW